MQNEEDDREQIQLMIRNYCKYAQEIDASILVSLTAATSIVSAQLSLIVSSEDEIDKFLEDLKEEVMMKKKLIELSDERQDKFYLI